MSLDSLSPPRGSTNLKYKGFISYSHAGDQRFAPALQHAVETFNRSLLRRRTIQVFRDDTNLTLSPHLWPDIENALRSSEFFLLLASPEAAGSKWVRRELEFWLEFRSLDSLLLIVTGGQIEWDDSTNDFDWGTTTALPQTLKGRYISEPLYCDCRWANADELRSLPQEKYQDAIATIAATLQGVEKAVLVSRSLKEQKKALRITIGAAAVLGLLFLASCLAGWWALKGQNSIVQNLGRENLVSIKANFDAVMAGLRGDIAEAAGKMAIKQWTAAESQRRRAEEEKKLALTRQLSAQAEYLYTRPGQLTLGSLLSIESTRHFRIIDNNRILASALSLTGHAGPELKHKWAVSDVAISPDGKWIATASNRTASVWNAATGSLRYSFDEAKYITKLAVSPDGRWLVTASADKSLRIVDFSTGIEHRSLLVPESAVSITISPDCTQVLVSFRRSAQIYNFPSATIITTLRPLERQVSGGRPNDGPVDVKQVAFSADGHWFVTLSPDSANSISVWESDTGQEKFGVGRQNEFYKFALDNCSRWIAAGGSGGPVKVFASDTGKEITHLDNLSVVTGLAFSQDGNYLAVGSMDGSVGLWVTKNWKQVRQFRHEDIVGQLKFSPDGTWLAVNCQDNSIHLWDTSTGEEKSRLQHSDRINSFALSQGGSLLVTASRDSTARVWKTDRGRERIHLDLQGYVFSTSVSAESAWVGATGEDNVRVWSMSDPAQMYEVKTPHPTAIGVSPEGKYLTTVDDFDPMVNIDSGDSGVSTVRLWNLATGVSRTLFASRLDHVVVGRAGRTLVGSKGSLITVWDTLAQKEKFHLNAGAVDAMVLSLDEQWIVTGGGEKTHVWRMADGGEQSVVRHQGVVKSVTISRDAKWIATGGESGLAQIWETKTGRAVVEFNHGTAVDCVAISPSRRWIATCSRDRLV